MLRSELKSAKLFSQNHLDCIRNLTDAVSIDVENSIENGDMPVFKTKSDTLLTITPSAKKQGMYQVTRYCRDRMFGDSQYPTIEDAIRDNSIIYASKLEVDEAEGLLQKVVEGESVYSKDYAI